MGDASKKKGEVELAEASTLRRPSLARSSTMIGLAIDHSGHQSAASALAYRFVLFFAPSFHQSPEIPEAGASGYFAACGRTAYLPTISISRNAFKGPPEKRVSPPTTTEYGAMRSLPAGDFPCRRCSALQSGMHRPTCSLKVGGFSGKIYRVAYRLSQGSSGF